MKTPITYYGGKQRLADTIVSMIPPHRIYIEPFFGGGAVFFAKPKSYLEVINDKNDMLINFYLSTRDQFQSLKSMIQSTLHSEKMYYHAKDIWNKRVPSTDIERAWAVWLITNGSFGGSMHGGWKWGNGGSGSHAGITLRHKRAAFSEKIHSRLQDVQISCRDAIEVIKMRDSEQSFFYLDPPYPGCFQQHYSGYTHTDLFDLLQVLSTIKGKFILSNYWSQTLRYHILKCNWEFKKIEVNLKINNLGKSDLKKRTEILVYNFQTNKGLFD